jgi:hypothetical protein
MMTILKRCLVPGLPVILSLSCIMTPLAAQTFTPEHNSWNQPDLSGFWQVMNTAAYNVEPHTASTGVPAGLGVITAPADGMIPYTADARAQRDRNFADRFNADPLRHCYKPGVPRLTYLNLPFQIVQTENQVVMLSEYIHNTRTVHLDRREHLDGIEFWNGDSIGHYEGDTLVVDVAGFIGSTWLDQAGNFHSPQLKVTERYTPLDPDHLRYEATLEDPATYTQPWTMSMILYRHIEDDFRVLEYECHAYAEDDAAARAE